MFDIILNWTELFSVCKLVSTTVQSLQIGDLTENIYTV